VFRCLLLQSTSNTIWDFEAGISTVSEMEKLEQIIKPTIGILTNIGTAHDEGFANSQENKRKLKLLNTFSFNVP
jgi:UDP-N-acetylmuramyl pentapeptide synthase